MIRDLKGTERELAKTEVLTVVTAEKSRGKKWKGAAIGSAVGFGAGFFASAAVNSHLTASGPIWDGEGVAHYSAAGILAAGVGAIVGAIICHLHKHQEVLYKAR